MKQEKCRETELLNPSYKQRPPPALVLNLREC